MKVRFPMYFEVVGYHEMELPDDIDINDEDAIKEFLEENWQDIPLPNIEDCEYVMDSCVFDRDSTIKIVK